MFKCSYHNLGQHWKKLEIWWKIVSIRESQEIKDRKDEPDQWTYKNYQNLNPLMLEKYMQGTTINNFVYH